MVKVLRRTLHGGRPNRFGHCAIGPYGMIQDVPGICAKSWSIGLRDLKENASTRGKHEVASRGGRVSHRRECG